MLLDQETLRLIFGLKLRNKRQELALSLKELSRKTGLSPSYLNEIEKGKKYPKADKIRSLSQALDIAYEDLISLHLGEELKYISSIIEKNIMKGIPFDILGIPAKNLFELIADHPKQVGTLVGTLLELARTYNIEVEEFFAATLRAYLDVHQNYFPELEKKAQSFCQKYDFKSKLYNNPKKAYDYLSSILTNLLGYDIYEKDFSSLQKEIRDLYYFVDVKKRAFFINKKLDVREKVFLLLKEVDPDYLGIKERFISSQTHSIDSFDLIYNNFQASYFASAVLFPEKEFLIETKNFFDSETWTAEAFEHWVESYPGNYSSFFHRMTQLLPKKMGIKEIFMLGSHYNTQTSDLKLDKALHLSSLHTPHRVKTNEHYCRRWVTSSLIKKLLKNKKPVRVAAQRSQFWQTPNTYLCFAMAHDHELNKNLKSCLTLGIQMDENTRKIIKFAGTVKEKEVSSTCEQCGIENCKDRVAPPTVYLEKSKDIILKEATKSLLRQI